MSRTGKTIDAAALRSRGAVIAFAVLIVAAIGTGCKSSERALETAGITAAKNPAASKLSQEELREKLGAFYVEFVNVVESATSDAAAKTQDLDLRRRLVSARIRAVRACRQTALQRQPMAAFVDTWSLCIQLEMYLNSAEGQTDFGEAQPRVVKAATDLRRDIENLGTLFLKPNELAKIEEMLSSFAREHPFTAASDVMLPSRDATVGMPQFGWLLNLPLTPFRALQGVDQTAAAVHELTIVASGFATTARDTPRELSWQMELLLIQLRREMEGMLAEADRKQTNTQVTLTQLRGVIADSERTLKAATDTSAAIESTLKTYLQMVKEIAAMNPKKEEAGPPKEPARPFDILDYARTAEDIGKTATNLTRLLVEVQRTVGANALTERIKETQESAVAAISEAQTSARSLANHIALLSGIVIVVFFVALTGYRLVTARAQRNASGKG